MTAQQIGKTFRKDLDLVGTQKGTIIVNLGVSVSSAMAQSQIEGAPPKIEPHIRHRITGYINGVEMKKMEGTEHQLPQALEMMINELMYLSSYVEEPAGLTETGAQLIIGGFSEIAVDNIPVPEDYRMD